MMKSLLIKNRIPLPSLLQYFKEPKNQNLMAGKNQGTLNLCMFSNFLTQYFAFKVDVGGAAKVSQPVSAVLQVHHLSLRNLPGEGDRTAAGPAAESSQQSAARSHLPRRRSRL